LPRKHSIEKRLEVVMAGLKSEDSVREICKAHGIEVKTFYRWKNLFLEGGKQALAEDGQTDQRQQELLNEIKRLKELVADLSIENHLLKKSD
jgi:transposase